jgi:hypothetical protein
LLNVIDKDFKVLLESRSVHASFVSTRRHFRQDFGLNESFKRRVQANPLLFVGNLRSNLLDCCRKPVHVDRRKGQQGHTCGFHAIGNHALKDDFRQQSTGALVDNIRMVLQVWGQDLTP